MSDREREGRTMQAARIEPTITYGNLIQTVVLMISVGSFVWWQSSFQTRTDEGLRQAQLRADKYIPMLESAVEANRVQDERILGIGESIRSLRDSTNSVLQQQNSMGEDIATIKATIQIRGK